MRVGFLGNARWSVPSLEAVARSSHRLALVATRTPRPGRRGGRALPTPVADAARRLDLPLLEVETVKSGEGFDALRSAALDVLVVVAYGEILPRSVLELPAIAPVNVHFSLLPQLRGAAPVQRAILEGVEVTGVTIIRMDEGLDTGPLLLQREEPVLAEDDAGSLGARLASIGARLLVETLGGLESGTLDERPQDPARATYAPKLRPEDQLIDWDRDAASIVRLVRALAPEPAAATAFRGRRLKILRASEHETSEAVASDAGPGSPGAVGSRGPGVIVLSSPEVVAVVAGKGAVRLEEVAPEGRRRMSGAEFVRGYRPGLDEAFG